MSRRRKRPPSRVVTQERPQEQRAARQPNIRPGATNYKPLTSQTQVQAPMKAYTPLSDKVLNQMYQNLGPQANQDYMYAPGVPLRPVPGLTPITGPRVQDYPVGYNIGQLPRSTEIYSFADLRALSTMYFGIQMCQQVWFDYISQLELDIKPIPSLIGEDGDTSMYEDDIQTYKDFFAYPDKDHDLHSWIQMAVKDQLEIDAVAIYPRKDRAGRLYALDLIDASMFTPLLDDRGRKPLPPFPAFSQFVHGVPASLLTSEELIYVKETERTDSLYGRSRTERVILNINVALRKQTKDLAHFTDGNLPPGFVTPSMDVQWSQEEIEAWEMQLNNLLAGNDELRARLRVLPRGFEYKAVTDNDDIHMELDQFILNITAACHGLTMAELAFTGDVNRSTGDSQENVVYRRAMGPLMKRYARLFTMILQKYFGEKRFIVSFKGYEEASDLQSNATAYSTLTGAGILGLTDAKKLLKLPEDPDEQYIGRVYMTQNGPIFLDDMANPAMRDAQNAAKLAGFDMATNPQLQPAAGGASPSPDEASTPPEGESDENESPAVARLMAQVEGILARLNRAEEVRTQVGGPRTGIMVAFMLDEDVAAQLALPDGEPAEDLHCTLCLLGDVEDFTGNVANLCQVLANFAYSARPVEGQVSGIARFNPSEEDNVTPVVALVNVHHLHHLRENVVHALELVGYEIDHTHSYLPHITLDYIPADDPMPINEVPELPLCFDTVWLCIGDERFPFHFGELPGERDDEDEEEDDHEQTERFITAMLHADEDEPLTTLERDWAAFDAKRVPKGRKPATTAADKKAQAALAREVKAQMKLMKIKASAATKEARQEAKNAKAQARVKATIAKTAARTAVAKAKLARQKAHIQAAAAKAKAARMAASAQKKQAAAVAKASRAQAAADKKQAAAEAKTAKSQAKAAKSLQSLVSTISSKAQIYQALSTRKTGKSWTAQDAQDAQAISNDLQQLTDHVNSHGNESDATGLLNSLASSIDALRAQHGITPARASVLDKLMAHAQQQLQRSVQDEDEWISTDNQRENKDDSSTPSQTQEQQNRGITQAREALDGEEKASRFTTEELVRLTQSVAAQGNQAETDRETQGSAGGDYKRWRLRAFDDVKAGRAIRTFTSTLIPERIHSHISTALERCTTQDEVREVFRDAQLPEYHWQDSNAPIQQFLTGLKEKGVESITWHAYLGACPECAINDGITLPLGKRFPSGAYIIPGHNHCVCQYTDSLGNRYEWAGADGEYKQLGKGKS